MFGLTYCFSHIINFDTCVGSNRSFRERGQMQVNGVTGPSK
jgi:hypothetical protein